MNATNSLPRRLGERSRSGWRLLLLALIVLGVAAVAYVAGSKSFFGDIVSTSSSDVNKLALPDSGLDAARNQLEVERKRHELDRRALEMVRSEIAGDKAQIAELEEELRFYRSLMTPGSIEKGVSLRAPELVQNSVSNKIALRIVVQQKARKHEMVKGKLIVRIIGDLAGQQVSYSLSELAEGVESEAVTLQFRYFQSVEGELLIPQGFEPKQISVTATTTKPQKTELGETYPWQLQEQFTHVGK